MNMYDINTYLVIKVLFISTKYNNQSNSNTSVKPSHEICQIYSIPKCFGKPTIWNTHQIFYCTVIDDIQIIILFSSTLHSWKCAERHHRSFVCLKARQFLQLQLCILSHEYMPIKWFTSSFGVKVMKWSGSMNPQYKDTWASSLTSQREGKWQLERKNWYPAPGVSATRAIDLVTILHLQLRVTILCLQLPDTKIMTELVACVAETLHQECMSWVRAQGVGSFYLSSQLPSCCEIS